MNPKRCITHSLKLVSSPITLRIMNNSELLTVVKAYRWNYLELPRVVVMTCIKLWSQSILARDHVYMFYIKIYDVELSEGILSMKYWKHWTSINIVQLPLLLAQLQKASHRVWDYSNYFFVKMGYERAWPTFVSWSEFQNQHSKALKEQKIQCKYCSRRLVHYTKSYFILKLNDSSTSVYRKLLASESGTPIVANKGLVDHIQSTPCAFFLS